MPHFDVHFYTATARYRHDISETGLDLRSAPAPAYSDLSGKAQWERRCDTIKKFWVRTESTDRGDIRDR